MNLKLTLRNDPSKIESNLKIKNINLRESLVKKTSKFETLKEDHEELHKYNIVVKGELTQCKQQLEKLYSSRENIDDSMPLQRLIYDKNGLGNIISMSMKILEIRLDLEEKDKTNDKIESSQSSNRPKEVIQENKVEILDESNKVESPKETRYEFKVIIFHVMK